MYDLYIFDLGNVIITDIDVVPSICRRLLKELLPAV